MAPRKVSYRQLELLLDFVETHRAVALGRSPGGPEAALANKALWKSIAQRLNAINIGATKSGDQWRRYWIELKAKTKTKAADSRRYAAAAGGGPSKLTPLTEHENRLLAIIDPAVDRLPGVRLPIKIPSDDEDTHDPLAGEFRLAAPVSRPRVPISALDNSTTEEELEEEWLDSQSLTTTPPPTADSRPAQDESRRRRASPSTGPRPVKRARLSRQFHESVTKWAHEIENRRIAAEEQQAAAMEGLAVAVAGLHEQMRRQADATEALLDIIRTMSER